MEWIKCSQENPPLSGEYIVCSSTGFRTVLDWSPFRGWSDDSTHPDDQYWNGFITHWMLLPEAPVSQ
jgi:hypothetical protein